MGYGTVSYTHLLKNPNLIEEIVRKVSSAISKPLTVKVRIGFENEPVDIDVYKRQLFDHGNPESIGTYSPGTKWMASLFQSVTTRTAGFFTDVYKRQVQVL